MENKKYFKNVSFLRFIFAIFIVLLHFAKSGLGHWIDKGDSLYGISNTFLAARFAVEFFFVMAGFFFVISYNPKKTFKEFVVDKIVRLWPVLIFTMLLFAICGIFKLVHFNTYDNLLSILLLNGIGLHIKSNVWQGLGNVHPSWFISCLFWIYCVFFYSCKNFKKQNFDFIIIILSYFLLHFCIYNHDKTIQTLIHSSITRSIPTFTIGYFLGNLWKEYKDKILLWKPRFFTKLLLTGLEIFCFFWILNAFTFNKMHTKNIVVYLIFFTTLFCLFIIQKGLFSNLLENNISVFLGKYSYSIYIVHAFILQLFMNYIWVKGNLIPININTISLTLTLGVIISVVLGVIAYHLVEYPCIRLYKNKKNIALKQASNISDSK